MMKKLWIPAACGALALSACSQSNDQADMAYQENATATADVAASKMDVQHTQNEATEASAAISNAPTNAASAAQSASRPTDSILPEREGPPAISTRTSPRVAFVHNYLFELPSKRISAVQEEHSRQCAELGTAQCEITDMDYRLDSDGIVNAETSFLLAPQVANIFGTSAIAAVDKADGKLVEGGMQGEDAGGLIEQSKTDNAARSREIVTLEQQAKGLRAGSPERVNIENDIHRLRGDNAQGIRKQEEARARLARTPITFSYKTGSGWFASGDGIIASNSDNVALTSLNAMLSLVAIVAPWLLLIGLIFWGWRRFSGNTRKVASETSATDKTAS